MNVMTSSDTYNAYKAYQSTSKQLFLGKNGNELIMDTLQELENAPKELADKNFAHFFMVDGPSGSGKTQLAIALAMKLREIGVPAGWLLAEPVNTNSQPVYLMAGKLTEGLLRALSYDVKANPGYTGEMLTLDDKKLYLFGFVVALAKRLNRKCASQSEGSTKYQGPYDDENDSVQIEAMDFMTAVSALAEEEIPVVFMDEYPRLQSDNENKLRLLRNVFRVLKVPLVVLGTDARISNMLIKDSHSRNSGERQLWCRLLLTFPQVVGVEEPNQELANSLAWRVWSHGENAWVKKLGLEFLLERKAEEKEKPSELEVLLDVAMHVREKWEQSKPKFLSKIACWSAIAQILLLSGGCLGSILGNDTGSDLVSHHMAKAFPMMLNKQSNQRHEVCGEPFVDIHITSEGYQVSADGEWGQLLWYKRFPAAMEDPTAFLTAIVGGKNLLQIEAAVVDIYDQLRMESSSVVCNESGATEKLDGDGLEFLVCACWVASTVGPNEHGSWYKPLSVVLANFFMHLTTVNARTRGMKVSTEAQDKKLQDLLDTKLAVAEPVIIQKDEESSNDRRIVETGLTMSSIERVKNLEQTDAKIRTSAGELIAVIECKNHTKNVGIEYMLQSIEKGHGAPLRLLVCNEVADIKIASISSLTEKKIRYLLVHACMNKGKASWRLRLMNDNLLSGDVQITLVVVPVVTLRSELGGFVTSDPLKECPICA
jgi:hypothetical protein